MNRIVHPPFDGERLAALKRPSMSLAGIVLLASLALALILSVAGLTVRAVAIAEHQHRIERV
ncbi:hypothetical protein HPDFL43_05685 [Hoeflea phototrophica DFL-43]|uniref:Uncharacterized protein n=1 Tax=Hoeflea phototrophica (strain DSM 17068 / NCIMB 14078 / DFL-43) TaxID=411684 RepID=A9D4N7_HOEPD|nr:hypothetical protein [Hoeflea phototrophica]EDQ33920.1 hypothetical protein HPDFL43_05685 [Hoeflea phototrophica DFL-43]